VSAAPDVYDFTSANRRMIADLLDSLSDDQWRAPTLCAGWTVHHMAAHLVQPMLIGFGRFFLATLPRRGDTAATVAHFTRNLARKPRHELVRLLREHADDRLDPPRAGPMGPFADSCIHLRDIARPLGLDADVPREHWSLLLDYLTSADVAPGLVRPRTLEGLELRAPDIEWWQGHGAEVCGTAEALALGITGRLPAIEELTGGGVGLLRSRVLTDATRLG